jgi:phenylacetate-CoA ligase
VIRPEAFEGTLDNWGRATADVAATGPAVLLNIERPVDEQVAWLQAQAPSYLLTHPTNLEAILRHCTERGLRIPRLLEARTLAESLSPQQRALCTEVWGIPVTDIYSAREAGYIALQCPDAMHYHVQSENVVVEIVDERGRACLPGEEGRVLLTVLNNFAMPLVRYEVGDIAVPGAACACGRGLPVIERIAGRVRNMMTLPDGRRHWPVFDDAIFGAIELITQYQVVQASLRKLELHVVARRALTDAERETIRDRFGARLHRDFEIELIVRESIARGPGGKYEGFISRIGPPAH